MHEDECEAAFWKSVLIGEKAIVGPKAEIRLPLHCFGEDMRSEPPRRR